MDPQPAGAGWSATKSEKRISYRKAWLLTIAVSIVILVAIVVAAIFDGLQIAIEQQTLTVAEASLPARRDLFAESVTTSPTVVAPSPAHPPQDTSDTAFVSPTEIAVPRLEGEGIVANVRIQETDRSLRSGPGTHYASRRPLYPSEQVVVLTEPKQVDGELWLLVRTGDGIMGWCMVGWLQPFGTEE